MIKTTKPRHPDAQLGDSAAVSATHLPDVSLQLCVHLLRLDEVFPGRVQVLLQLRHVTAEGGQALLHLALLSGLLVYDFLELHYFGKVFLVA